MELIETETGEMAPWPELTLPEPSPRRRSPLGAKERTLRLDELARDDCDEAEEERRKDVRMFMGENRAVMVWKREVCILKIVVLFFGWCKSSKVC